MVRVRSIRVTPSTEAEERESAATPRASLSADPPRARSRSSARRHASSDSPTPEPRQRPHSGSAAPPSTGACCPSSRRSRCPWGARLIPVDELQRLLTEQRRPAQKEAHPAITGPAHGPRTRNRPPDPHRTRNRQKPRPNRARPQRHRNTHSPRRRPMVAIHRARRPRSHTRLTSHGFERLLPWSTGESPRWRHHAATRSPRMSLADEKRRYQTAGAFRNFRP